jgi:integrase
VLYKRPGSPYWQVEFTLGGIAVRKSSGTAERSQAEEFEQALRQQAWDKTKLGKLPEHTWDEAVKRWLAEKKHKRSLDRDEQVLRDAGEMFAGKPLSAIVDEIPEYASRIAEYSTEGNANAHLRILRALLRRAVRVWKWKGIDGTVVMYQTDKFEPRWITREQFETLHNELPEHQRPIARCAVTTGLRLSNVLQLRRIRPVTREEAWPWVSQDGTTITVPGVASKSKRVFTIPLSADARALLSSLPKAPNDYVFMDHLGRSPVGTVHGAWEKACERAGLAGLRFHDLRHTWATWMRQAGTPKDVLQALGGWQSAEMVEHYGHWDVEHLREWV